MKHSGNSFSLLFNVWGLTGEIQKERLGSFGGISTPVSGGFCWHFTGISAGPLAGTFTHGRSVGASLVFLQGAGFQDQLHQKNKAGVHSILMIYPGKSQSIISAILCWSWQ